MKREHKTPLFAPAVAALKSEQQRQLQQGQSLADVRTGYVFPAAWRPGMPCDRGVFYKLWFELRKLRPDALPARLGFHALRRKMASDRSDAPSAIVAAAGGWLNPDVAVRIYQRPTVKQMREAVERVRGVA